MSEDTAKLMMDGTDETAAYLASILSEDLKKKAGKLLGDAIERGMKIGGKNARVNMGVWELNTLHLLDGTTLEGHLLMVSVYRNDLKGDPILEQEFFIPMDLATSKAIDFRPYESIPLH
jgi:hypothetical protein